MLDVGEVKGEARGKGRAGARAHVAKNLQAAEVPAQRPGQDRGGDDDCEAVRDVGDFWTAFLEALLKFAGEELVS